MNDWFYESRNRRDGVTVPTIWVAIVLSILVHVAALWTWLPQIRLRLLDKPDRGEASALVVRLAPPLSTLSPPPSPRPSPAVKPAPPAASPKPSAKVTPRPQPAPPVIALNRTKPETPAPSPATPPATARAQPPGAGDLSSYIEARRRARDEPPSAASPPAGSPSVAPPAEDAGSRTNRIVAENLGLNRKPTFGPDPTHGGGVFQIQRLGYNDAEFFFYGWNRDIRRNTTQLIEVRKGNNSDIRIAVVRRMIAIIREYEQEDFTWESRRLGRHITLSARARDNAGLEEFMLREFPEFATGPSLPR